MEFSSNTFPNGGKIPIRHVMPGAGGKNISVHLAWKDAPAGTKSFALSMVDPHPVAQNWIHWFVVDIPARADSFEEGISGKNLPEGSRELINSFGDTGYGGPEPPTGSGDHPYVFTLYALSVEKLDIGAKTSLSAFRKALEGKTLATATITGLYGR
jgi:Raf kinase inhibitor-like YbhB/YbcL family protein